MWQPTDRANLQGWYHTDNGCYKDLGMSQPATSLGDLVKLRADFSGNNRHLTQDDSQDRIPLYSTSEFGPLPGLKFDGSNDAMYNKELGALFAGQDVPFTLFSIMKKWGPQNAGDKAAYALGSTSANNNPQHYFGDDGGHWKTSRRGDNGVPLSKAGGSITLNTPKCLVWLFTGTTITLRVDGQVVFENIPFDAGVMTCDNFSIGSIVKHDGGTIFSSKLISLEEGIYSDIVMGQDLTDLELYLASRAGV